MIVRIDSPLEGEAAERFLAVARALSRFSGAVVEQDVQSQLNEEIAWCRNSSLVEGVQTAYEASIRVLFDLARLAWQIHLEGHGVELIAPRTPIGSMSPEAVLLEKERTRALFRPLVNAQFAEDSVRTFIRALESPTRQSGKKPITLLVADGAEIAERLRQDAEKGIEPYLQCVDPATKDHVTGHRLRDIWRYFRYSWAIPQAATPGRQLLYLVRDAAATHHPVMAIIALNNSALQLGSVREAHLGWTLEAIKARLCGIAERAPQELPDELDWMERQIASALTNVEPSGLVEPAAIERPNHKAIARLRRKEKEFDSLRDEALRALAIANSDSDVPRSDEVAGSMLDSHPPVSDAMLGLERTPTTQPALTRARRHLIARKRAALLADLLSARLALQEARSKLIHPNTIAEALERNDVQVAIGIVLTALKSRYAGINMLEISTCGAVPPYNHVLAGKLASLLLFSPEVAADYRRRYSGPSIIASQMKNRPVLRSNELVYLWTTSLYAQGSSQYARLRLPAQTLSPEQPELRFDKRGLTAGYGTLQFAPATRAAVERHLSATQRFKDVNSIFGEGPSPKLRKLVAGLRAIGFPPDALMRHNRPRLVYAVSLCAQAVDYLNARPCRLPDYVANPDQHVDATTNIVAFWQRRWLASRLRHGPSISALRQARTWRLSEHISPASGLGSVGGKTPKNHANGRSKNTIWHELARSGPQVASDSLTEDELNLLHISQPIDSFLQRRVLNGDSVFLTGNAGDGKTHLIRRLRQELAASGAEIIEDATALMRSDQTRFGNVEPIFERWRSALSAGRPFVAAINEYPLYLMLRAPPVDLLKKTQELRRQVEGRIAYGEVTPEESVRGDLLVVDLSVRNPLRGGFALACLRRILEDPELNREARAGTPLERNLTRLKQPSVQRRFGVLFDKLADFNLHVTVRELWIVLARAVLGYRSDCPEALGNGTAHWYSNALFQYDPRFSIYSALRDYDPAASSHPVWDARLENADPQLTSGWVVTPPNHAVASRLNRCQFSTLKRAFYFEHKHGLATFDLEQSERQNFADLLRGNQNDDSVTKGRVVEAINRAYCQRTFPGIAHNLYLWNGHRYHEQPSEVFLANQRIGIDELSLSVGRLPTRVSDAFPDYTPQHIALRHRRSGVSLVIDSDLFSCLTRLASGLPRKLLADQDTFRLESFIDALSSRIRRPERTVISAHLRRREVVQVELDPSLTRYESVRKH